MKRIQDGMGEELILDQGPEAVSGTGRHRRLVFSSASPPPTTGVTTTAGATPATPEPEGTTPSPLESR